MRKQCKTCPSIENYLRFNAVRDIEHIYYTPADKGEWPTESLQAQTVPGMMAQEWKAPALATKGLNN